MQFLRLLRAVFLADPRPREAANPVLVLGLLLVALGCYQWFSAWRMVGTSILDGKPLTHPDPWMLRTSWSLLASGGLTSLSGLALRFHTRVAILLILGGLVSYAIFLVCMWMGLTYGFLAQALAPLPLGAHVINAIAVCLFLAPAIAVGAATARVARRRD